MLSCLVGKKALSYSCLPFINSWQQMTIECEHLMGRDHPWNILSASYLRC